MVHFGAKRPRLHLWGVAERSESFKIMIAGGNHTAVKSWQPERADLSARRRYASEQPLQAALSESQRGCRAYFAAHPCFAASSWRTPSASRSLSSSPKGGAEGASRRGVYHSTGCLRISRVRANRRIKIAHSRRRRGSQRNRQTAPRGGYSGFWKYLLPQNTR